MPPGTGRTSGKYKPDGMNDSGRVYLKQIWFKTSSDLAEYMVQKVINDNMGCFDNYQQHGRITLYLFTFS